MDNAPVRAEDLLDSASNSGASDLSVLNENETDELGRRILQHQREKREQRQPFWRARPRPRPTDAVLTWADSTKTRQSHQRTRSAESTKSDPPLNVPREWGKRARIRSEREWVRTHGANGEQGDMRGTKDDDAIFPHRTAYTGDENPIMSPKDIIIPPSIENTPPPMRRQRQFSSPSSLRHMNTTLDLASRAEDVDFNDASLLVSTPIAVNHRNRKIDGLIKKEIETVEKQEITTRTVTQLNGRADSALSVENDRAPRRRSSRLSDNENIPTKGEAEILGAGQTTNVPSRKSDVTLDTHKPGHTRNDSIALLRSLARVTSMSPSPIRNKLDSNVQDARRNSDAADLGRLSGGYANSASIGSAKSGETRRVRGSDARNTNSGHVLENRKQREEKPSTNTITAPEDMEPTNKLSVVTGARGDTSGQPQDKISKDTTADPSRAQIPSFSQAVPMAITWVRDRDPRRILSEPNHPKSALEAVVQDARNKRDPNLGDSTIASLEDIVNPDLEPTNSTMTQEADKKSSNDEPNANIDENLPQAEKVRQQEDNALENLNKRLRFTRTTIKDANRGLRRIENRIEAAEAEGFKVIDVEEVPQGSKPPFPRHLTPYTDHTGRTICEHCGGSYTSVWRGLWTEFTELFYTWEGEEKKKNPQFRPTFLGWFSLLLATWFLLETILSNTYSHVYHVSMPFVIPSLALRPFHQYLQPLLDRLARSSSSFPSAGSGSGSSSGGGAANPIPTPSRLPDHHHHSAPVRTPPLAKDDAEWILATAARATATATKRIVSSAAEAVDQYAGSMWDDDDDWV